MPKIVKNGKEYSGVPIECVTAWQPTGDPVQVAEPLMGNTDISDIGDGTITGAIRAVDACLLQMLTIEVPVSSQSVASMRRTYHEYTIPTGYKPVGALYVGTDDNTMSAIVCKNIARIFNTDLNTHTANGTIYVFLFPDSN